MFLPTMGMVYAKVKKDISEQEEQIKHIWRKELQMLYENICEMQEQEKLQNVGLVCISFLRTRYLKEDFKYAVYVYEEDGFLGKEFQVGDLDASYFFQYHKEALEYLQKEAKKYFGKITTTDVDRLMLEEVGRNTLFSFFLFRKWKPELFQMEQFHKIKKTQTFQIILGEYFEPKYLLYEQVCSIDKRKQKRNLRKEQKQYLENYSNLNLDGSSFKAKDFLDATFENVSLRNSQWVNCAAQGTSFQQVILSQSKFYQCMLQESRWMDSEIRDVVFEECLFYKGESISRKQFQPDYGEVILENCNLAGTKFIRCNLAGVDFTRSNIENCIFEDCELTGCIFTSEQVRNQNLDI